MNRIPGQIRRHDANIKPRRGLRASHEHDLANRDPGGHRRTPRRI